MVHILCQLQEICFWMCTLVRLEQVRIWALPSGLPPRPAKHVTSSPAPAGEPCGVHQAGVMSVRAERLQTPGRVEHRQLGRPNISFVPNEGLITGLRPSQIPCLLPFIVLLIAVRILKIETNIFLKYIASNLLAQTPMKPNGPYFDGLERN